MHFLRCLGVKVVADITTRKCAKCKGEIEINKHNITDVIYFNKLYYHESCFKDIATEKSTSKRGKPQMWQDALDNIWELEAETKKMLEHFCAKDDLNMWLLNNYDIVTVPSYFWQLVADLESGKYKNKRCKPMSITMLYPMWRWGQKHLDKIALNNKTNRKGPQNDNDRLRYDLAILISHTEDFKKHQNRVKAEKAEAEASVQKEEKNINYNTINKVKEINKNQKDDDISSLVDEIFG